MAPRKILPEVLGVHRAVQALLRGGRQRLRQTRELLRIDSELLAHACLLLGDLGQYQAAREYGSAALLCAQEAEADEGIAWSVMAKTARWQVRFAEAAELARRGFEVSGRAAVRAELAYREANAIALFGDAAESTGRAAARGTGRRGPRRRRHLGLVFLAAAAGDLRPVGLRAHRRPRRRPARRGGRGRLLGRRRPRRSPPPGRRSGQEPPWPTC